MSQKKRIKIVKCLYYILNHYEICTQVSTKMSGIGLVMHVIDETALCKRHDSTNILQILKLLCFFTVFEITMKQALC